MAPATTLGWVSHVCNSKSHISCGWHPISVARSWIVEFSNIISHHNRSEIGYRGTWFYDIATSEDSIQKHQMNSLLPEATESDAFDQL